MGIFKVHWFSLIALTEHTETQSFFPNTYFVTNIYLSQRAQRLRVFFDPLSKAKNRKDRKSMTNGQQMKNDCHLSSNCNRAAQYNHMILQVERQGFSFSVRFWPSTDNVKIQSFLCELCASVRDLLFSQYILRYEHLSLTEGAETQSIFFDPLSKAKNRKDRKSMTNGQQMKNDCHLSSNCNRAAQYNHMILQVERQGFSFSVRFWPSTDNVKIQSFLCDLCASVRNPLFPQYILHNKRLSLTEGAETQSIVFRPFE